MAFSALKQCRSMMQSQLPIRSLASSTTPKFAASVAIDNAIHQHSTKVGRFKTAVNALGPAAPVIGILGGMILVAGGIGVHTAKQQFFHSPSVQVTKKKRECMPEVDDPDAVIQSAGKFLNKSFIRKVAHIQDREYVQDGEPNIYTRSQECETLKSVGVIN